MKTTLNEIRKYQPCTSGWEKLLSYLGKTKADDEPLSLLTILDSNGLDDALWCLRAVEGYDREIRLYVVWCARQVQHLMTDQRSIDVLDVAERYANGEATDAELTAAAEAAWSAARNAAEAAWSASAAACAAARAAEADARDVAMAAAWGDAREAAAAAWAAAWAAEDAAEAAWAAEAAARGDARTKQEAELRRICGEGE